MEQILCDVANSGRTLLTELESKELLAVYDIPTVKTILARNEDEAANVATTLGFPVVLKLHSHTVTHKTDVGGVKLNLENVEHGARGFSRHPIFGSRKGWRGSFPGSHGSAHGVPRRLRTDFG